MRLGGDVSSTTEMRTGRFTRDKEWKIKFLKRNHVSDVRQFKVNIVLNQMEVRLKIPTTYQTSHSSRKAAKYHATSEVVTIFLFYYYSVKQ